MLHDSKNGSQRKQMGKQSACCRRRHAGMDLLPEAVIKKLT